MDAIPVSVIMTTAIEGEDTVTARYDGLLRYAPQGIRLSYTESEEGVRTSTLLSISHSEIGLTRRGGVDFSTIYRAGYTHHSLYTSGALRLDAAVTTEHLSLITGLALPAFSCSYTLTLGGVDRRFILTMRLERREVSL